jgi:hypothetical protein
MPSPTGEQQLRDRIIQLGPWHLEVEVTPDLTTGAWLDAGREAYPDSLGPVSHLDLREPFWTIMRSIYPDGLEGRSVMDCACNCGGYLFWAKEIGAGECFGFDVRGHWIEQAEFLLEHRRGPTDGMRFEVLDLYELPNLELQPFDITLFNGLFYHLPDPIHGLKLAADRTSELLFMTTASRTNVPDGCLSIESESSDAIMSGVYGLNWLPTGPEVLSRILRWLGFVETHTVWHDEEPVDGPPGWGWTVLVASKVEGLLRHAATGWPPRQAG